MGLERTGKISILKLVYYIIILISIIAIIFTTACGSENGEADESTASALPSGQVKGTLTFEKGLSRPTDIFLGSINDAGIELNTSWQSHLTSGGFLIENVPSGKYCLIGFWNTTGSFGYLLTEDEKITFEIPQDNGINLKSLNVSEIDYLNK